MCFDPFKKSFWQSGRLSFWNLNYSLCSECFLVELTHSFMPIMPCGTYGGYKGSSRPSVPAQLLDGTPGVLHGLELCLHSSVPVFLGLLLLRFPSGVQWRDVRVMLSCSLLMTCPIHLHRLRMMMVSMLSWLQRASSCWLEMVSGQKICRILLRFFVWKTDSLVMSLSVVVGWTSHSFGRSSAWSWRSTEKTSTRCWAFWRRFWPCWDGSWCHPLLDHHALLCCSGKWTL